MADITRQICHITRLTVDNCRNGTFSVQVAGSGVSAGMNSLIGTSGPTSCYTANNSINTGLQQASVIVTCIPNAGSSECKLLYDVRSSCSTVVTPPVTNTTAQMVCFQPYNNNTCGAMLGGLQCSSEGRCTHVDGTIGADESTLQTCNNGYVTISVFKNSSSCRPSHLAYAIRVNTSGCQNVGGHWGTMSCSKWAWLERHVCHTWSIHIRAYTHCCMPRCDLCLLLGLDFSSGHSPSWCWLSLKFVS